MPNEYAKSELVMDSLNSDIFKPEVIAFGTSIVQTGVNGYVLREELDNDKVYNLGAPDQGLYGICGYFPYLPSTVKVVIIGAKIDEFAVESNEIRSSSVHDSIFQSYVSSRINLTNQFSLITNFKNRGSLNAGIQIIVRKFVDDDAPGGESMSIVYPYLYPSDRSPTTYERDIFEENKFGNILNGKVINSDYIELLKRINDYLKAREIEFIVFLSPTSPDITYTTEESTKDFISQIEDHLPEDLHFVNCFYLLSTYDFYDSVHPNRQGAKKISIALAKQILHKGKVCNLIFNMDEIKYDP